MERKMRSVLPDGYNSPEVEIVEICVEKGFAGSNEGVGEEEGEGSFN